MEPRRQQACLTSCVLTDAAIRTTYSVAGPLVRNIRDSVPLTQYGTSVTYMIDVCNFQRQQHVKQFKFDDTENLVVPVPKLV